MPKRKRKNDIVEQLNGTREQIKKLYVPYSLPCEICKKPVFNYRELKDVVCSYNCEGILYLSRQNRFLHEKDQIKTFESEMIRSPSRDNLNEYDNMSIDR